MTSVKNIIYGIITLLCAFAVYNYIYSNGAGSDLQDNRSAAYEVRSSLEQAVGAEQESAKRIQTVEDVARSITEGIKRSEAAVGNAGKPADAIEAGVGEAGELIARCQQILGEVRRGSETGAQDN